MKYGILGDIHANLSALQAVLGELDRERIDVLVSVGDVVGYGAAPLECIEILRSRGAVVVKGNHDAACVGQLEVDSFNPYARAAVGWTQRILGRTETAWLSELPYSVALEHCEVSHGTIYQPELFDYLLSSTDADPSLDHMVRPVGFVGHTHIPICMLRFPDEPHRTATCYEPRVDLTGTHRALLNVGSVGQPRDEDPKAAYAIFDSDRRSLEIRRTPYDVDREAVRILSAGLPEVLAQRLRLGI